MDMTGCYCAYCYKMGCRITVQLLSTDSLWKYYCENCAKRNTFYVTKNGAKIK